MPNSQTHETCCHSSHKAVPHLNLQFSGVFTAVITWICKVKQRMVNNAACLRKDETHQLFLVASIE